MASRRVKRKPKQPRATEWMVFWATAFVGVILAACFVSPLTRLSVVHVSGVPVQDREHVAAALRSLSQRPALRIRSGDLEAQLLGPAVQSLSFRANVFGRGRLRLVYRKPVAVLANGLAVDEIGCAFPVDERLPLNLHISRKVEDFSTILTISDPSPLRRLARLAKKIQVSMPKLAGTLEIDDKEGLSLTTDGLVVEFGDTSRLDRKVQVLAELFREEPQRAAGGGRIILVDPDNAVQRR